MLNRNKTEIINNEMIRAYDDKKYTNIIEKYIFRNI